MPDKLVDNPIVPILQGLIDGENSITMQGEHVDSVLLLALSYNSC